MPSGRCKSPPLHDGNSAVLSLTGHDRISTSPSDALDLVTDRAGATSKGYLKAAGSLMPEGGFNINSTSVEAWTAVLSAARKKQPVSMPGGASLKTQDRGSQVISRNPNPVVTDEAENSRWLG